MKPLIVCFSLTGHTRKICGCLAKSLDADYTEIKELSRRSRVSAYTLGVYDALRHKNGNIRPLAADVSHYDRLIVATPVWAGNIPPAVNDFVREYELHGKTVYGLVTHAGGPGQAMDFLKQELEQAGASCPNVLGVLSSREAIHELKAGRLVFALDEDGKLALKNGDPQK